MVDYDQIEDELDLYERGRLLKTTIHTVGWPEVLEVVKSYLDDMDAQLKAIPVGDPSIIAAHAGVHVMSKFYQFFQEDIDNAIKMADNPSPELLEYIASARRKFDVKAMMEAQTPSR